MILDVFTYCGEQQFLESRVATLSTVTDCHVEHLAVIANRSHQGDRWSGESLAEWTNDCADLGVHVHAVDLSHLDGTPRGGAGLPGYQVRERHHRLDATRAALRLTTGLDVIALSDVDEIPHPLLLCAVRNDDVPHGFVFTFAQRMHPWSAEWLYPGPWLGTTIARRSTVEAFGLQWMRDARGTDMSRTIGEGDPPRGGWHLSWWGDDNTRRRKLWTFSHYELVGKQDDLASFAERGIDINGVGLQRVDPHALDWPAGIVA